MAMYVGTVARSSNATNETLVHANEERKYIQR
jgi:hypothetical protein